MIRFFYAFVFGLVLLSGCVTEPDEPLSDESEFPIVFIARPRFKKPVFRPLGRVLLSWESVAKALGYEIQAAETKDFSNITEVWTLSGTDLELPVESDDVVWFRIRSFGGDNLSQWSTPLRISEKNL